jgi:hypothetical protein
MQSVLKLPLGGCRNHFNGSLYYVASDSYYWSSTVSGDNTRYLYFGSSDAYLNANGRGNGFSVRCIQD